MEPNISNAAPNEVEFYSKRPLSITVICVIGFIGAALAIPVIFSGTAKNIGNWYPPLLAFSAIVGAVCFVGLWKMKKWTAYSYAAFTGLNQIIMLVMGIWNIFALLIPGIVIFVAFKNIAKMS